MHDTRSLCWQFHVERSAPPALSFPVQCCQDRRSLGVFFVLFGFFLFERSVDRLDRSPDPFFGRPRHSSTYKITSYLVQFFVLRWRRKGPLRYSVVVIYMPFERVLTLPPNAELCKYHILYQKYSRIHCTR